MEDKGAGKDPGFNDNDKEIDKNEDNDIDVDDKRL